MLKMSFIRPITPLLWLILFSQTLCSQEKAPFTSPQQDDFLPLLQHLSAPEMEGRETATNGGKSAARFLTEKMKEIGLQPIGDSFLQPFKLLKTTLISAGFDTGDKHSGKLLYLTDFAAIGCPSDRELTAELVFAGYGLISSDSVYNSYHELEVRDKIVVVIDGLPGEADTTALMWKTFGKEFLKQENGLKTKLQHALNLGAKALLLIQAGSDTSALTTWMTNLTGNDRAQYPDGDYLFPMDTIRQCIPVFLLHHEARQLLGRHLTMDFDQAALNLAEKPFITAVPGKKASLQTDQELVELHACNVIGMIKGTDSTKTVVIGAHYDHLGKRGDQIYFGADDNASGTSGVLTLAKKWLQSGIRPSYNLVFACWDAEEKGLFGSSYFVENLTKSGHLPTLYLNMDMISRSAESDTLERVISIGIRAGDSSLRQLSNDCNVLSGKRFELDIWDVNGHSGSDYAAFAAAGVPVMTFFSGFHQDYHSPRDRFEAVNPEKMAAILKFIQDCVWNHVKP